ncbi:unnamed protein product [Trichobilharzia szidati]|nr:unnamed protein product [Trichobilharzia szidati]
MNRCTVFLLTIVAPLLVQSNLGRSLFLKGENINITGILWSDSFKMLVKSDKSNEDNGRYFEEMNRNRFWGWNEDYETLLHFSESFDGMANRSEIDWKFAESQMNETKNYLLGKLKRRTLLDKFVECSTQNSEILYRLRLYAGNFTKVMKPHIRFVRMEIAKLRVLSGVFREMADAINKVEVENNRIQYPMIQQQ